MNHRGSPKTSGANNCGWERNLHKILSAAAVYSFNRLKLENVFRNPSWFHSKGKEKEWKENLAFLM
jgi:hypothetical protein